MGGWELQEFSAQLKALEHLWIGQARWFYWFPGVSRAAQAS